MITAIKINNFAQTATCEYDEERGLIGNILSDFDYRNKMWSGLINNFPSFEINIGALLNIVGLLSSDEIKWFLSISKIVNYDPHVFYIAKMDFYYDGNLCCNMPKETLDTIANIDYISDYLGISQIDCSDFLNKLIMMDVINETHIVDKKDKPIYIVNPEVFCNSYYLNKDVEGLYKLKEMSLTYYDIFFREFEKLKNGTYILDPNDTNNENTEKDESGRNSFEYREWKQSVLERDNYTCQCCESTLNPDVHHILNYAQYKDIRTDIDNGIVLCQCCHSPMIKGSYHNTFGTRNNTKEQLQEYITNKRQELGLESKVI